MRLLNQEPAPSNNHRVFEIANCDLKASLESIATPYSVNARGGYRRPPCAKLEVAICDLKLNLEIANCDLKFSASSLVSRNMKSSGKRFLFRETCSLRLVGTPYNSARSASIITF